MRTLHFHVSGGTHITSACEKATAMAKQNRAMVRFNFNETALFATPKKSPVTIEWEFQQATDRAGYRYRHSKAGRDFEAFLARQLAEHQAKIQSLITVLPLAIVGGMDSLMTWVKKFTPAADYEGVFYPSYWIREQLETAGYESGKHVGQKPEWFTTRQRVGEWILGQVLSSLEMGMPPHPVAVSFCEKYFALPQEAA
jgi:hypothetical protein